MIVLLSRLVLAAAEVLLGALLISWLWDRTMPRMTNLRKFSYWHIVRLLLIAGIAAEVVLLIVGLLTAVLPVV